MSKTKTHCEPTISDVKSLFEAWRQTRKKRERIPEALWHQALKLVDRYSISVITTRLGINSKQIKDAQLRHGQAKTTNDNNGHGDKAITFIEAKVPPSIILSDATESNLCIMEIQRADGAKLKVDRIPVGSLSNIINQFVR